MLTNHPLYPIVLSYPIDTIGVAYTILADCPTITDPADLARRVYLADYRDRHGRCRGNKTFAISYESYRRGSESADMADSKSTARMAEIRGILGDNLADALLNDTAELKQAAKLAGVSYTTAKRRIAECRSKIKV